MRNDLLRIITGKQALVKGLLAGDKCNKEKMLGEIWQEDILLRVNCTQEKGL